MLEFRPGFAKSDYFSQKAQIQDFSVKSPSYQIGSFFKTLKLKKKILRLNAALRLSNCNLFILTYLLSAPKETYFYTFVTCFGEDCKRSYTINLSEDRYY